MTRPILILLILLPLLTACGSDAPTYTITEPGTWHDGTYTAQADGYRSSFSVSVTIAEGHLAEITVGAHSETPERGGQAIDTMIPAMIEAQTYDVDATSGATRTSDALRDAVARCLEEASAQ